MQEQLDIIFDFSKRCLRIFRSWLIEFTAERPVTAFSMIITFCVILLPVVTSAALMPFSVLLDLGHILVNKGLIYVIYTLVFQVTILVGLILVLFLAAFLAGTSATILHSYVFSK